MMPDLSEDAADALATLITDALPDVLNRKREPAPTPKKGVILFPTSIHVDDDEPLPTPTLKAPTPEELARLAKVNFWVSAAEWVRQCLNRPVVMVDSAHNVLDFVDPINLSAEPKTLVRSNCRLVFSTTPQMEALALPICDLVVVRGPEVAHDIFGADIFADTTRFFKNDEDVVRLYRPSMPLDDTKRSAEWKSWKLTWQHDELIVLDGAEIRLPKNASSPIAALGSRFMGVLCGGRYEDLA